MTVIAWLLVLIGYDGAVQVATYPTEAPCQDARTQANTRDHLCVPAVMVRQ